MSTDGSDVVLKRWQAQALYQIVASMPREIKKLRAQLEIAKEALKKYSDPEIYGVYDQDPVEFAIESLEKMEKIENEKKK